MCESIGREFNILHNNIHLDAEASMMTDDNSDDNEEEFDDDCLLVRCGCLKITANMLNIPSQSFPAASSQQRVSPSGQSGRNKVALKPGHSLIDWIRFTKSGKDLTGLRGRLIEVTQEELQKHNTRNDCWTCIRGMVYNVTPYMDYHPGGEQELMLAAGVDGTDLFDQVHRWVNYESMLKECLVGRMAVKTTAATKATLPPPSPTGLTRGTSVGPPPNKDSHPRYDWFQSDVSVHLVVYAKRKIPRSGCTVVDLQDGLLRLEVLLGKMSYMIHLRLAEEVKETVSVHTAFAVGKIQVSMIKQAGGHWSSLGQPLEGHNTFVHKTVTDLFYRTCLLVSKSEVNYNTILLQLKLPGGSVMHVPVGKHVYLKSLTQDIEVVRPYTPIDSELVAVSDLSSQESYLYLMIKIYPDGVFTQLLEKLRIGDSVSVSNPQGNFSIRPLRNITHLFLLAAGTGLSPMVRLIKHALQDIDTLRMIKLLFFNRQEKDILWRHQLDHLEAQEERFQVEYVLSEACENWTSRKGRIEESMLKDFLHRASDSKCFVCVCGPTAFTDLAVRLVKQQGFNEEELHAFQG
ncbi:cytochrome b5 reductase 4 isoform X2 [Synchiropus splendidus]|uniref:cytochrome b5 reductase 4 isoform X2 n=1 Tax=Synchiropus splendidus TaxID=270530 RepID=UPI00237D420C|nr:cytochrome b5 reductase 4 isoform X2 [Synchiropus splendidus]